MPRLLLPTGAALLEVRLRGAAGPLVVVLPGAGGGTDRFQGLASALVARGFRVALVEPRGAGASVGRGDVLTLHDHAADVAALIRRLQPDRPAHLVGFAWGNRVARCTAADHPDLVDRVALVGAGGRVPPEPAVLEALRIVADLSASEDERREAARLAFHPPGAAGPSSGARLPDPRAARAHRAAAERTWLDDWWDGGTAPMLVVQGALDRVASPANGRALRDAHPRRVRLVEIPGAAHAVPHEAILPPLLAFLSPQALRARMRALPSRTSTRKSTFVPG